MAGSIQNLEIFAAGTHRASTGTITVTEEELDQIVESFNSLKDTNIVKPHLKLGHTEAQNWFGQKNGIPTLGWITSVWREGRKLLANVSEVPDALLAMIRSGRYHNVSAEVFYDPSFEYLGRKFSRVLSAVAVLGVEMPAVKDLGGLANALFQAEQAQFTEQNPTSITLNRKEGAVPDEKGKGLFSQEQVDTLVSAAASKAETDAKTEFASQLENKDKEIEVATKRAEDAESNLKVVKAEAANAEAITLVNDAIKEGKLLPKQKDFALAALTSKEAMLKFEDGEKSLAQAFNEFIDASGKQVDLGENGSGESSQKEFSTAAEEVDSKTRDILKEDPKVEYSAAMDQVLASDEDLKNRYVNGQV